MKSTLNTITLCILSLSSSLVFAKPDMEVITVSSHINQFALSTEQAKASVSLPDVSDWLLSVPGANANKNGQISGIAQYRGYYGDQVAVAIDGVKQIGAGPNAMDAPLSYVSPLLINSVDVYRGIAPVSSALDSFGGVVKVHQKRAADIDAGERNLALTGTYLSNYSGYNVSAVAGAGFDEFALNSYVALQNADDYKDGDGREVHSSQVERLQYGVDVAYRQQASSAGLIWQRTDTKPTGTIALPMDIDYVESDRIKLDYQTQINDLALDAYIAYHTAEHGMDNYSQRSNANRQKHRYNTTDVENLSYFVAGKLAQWQFGLEGYVSEHGSRITNPNNAMFFVENFNQVEDNRHSIFTEWQSEANDFSQRVGVRVKYNQADAGTVSSIMAMMNPHIKMLQQQFNNADRSVNDTTVDISYSGRAQHSERYSTEISFGLKQRAPSYQQRYLWLPMQATGGLADGKTYIGNIDLNAETAYQLNLAWHYQANGFSISPQIFYHQIDDYIQGTPSNNMAANMVGTMMGGEVPLQFNNIDAHLFGADVNLVWRLNNQWQLTGVVSYVTGEREDIDDDLYRIAPLNSRITAHYQIGDWHSQLTLNGYAKQTKVSELNNEKESAGYGTLDWQLDYDVTAQLRVNFGVNNLLDKAYRPHLNGVNRAMGSEIMVGEGVPEVGRNVFVGFNMSL
ncbi:Vitamin B12 transporter BtuB [Pseudoalteromonas sp. P1-9]|uniref:TonB-dependent receptor n=1 Tax=Pseudoalteromonas sp. P1-9 TaxID=1710354 RepID=UPI0006D5D42A|nr:TonB-dependent receptor [Pseudoalteromonas sp. P1-9]KPV98322.1 Vitamin B12 transporter BtuB [Pseudoalteromonas sp. P1-9]